MRRTFLVGAGVGAALMYFFDPSWGRRRRAQLQERIEKSSRQVEGWRARSEVRRAQDEEDDCRDDSEIDWIEGEAFNGTVPPPPPAF